MAQKPSTDELGIDPRQREAAAILLMAFDLPKPMHLVGRQLTLAAAVCPGISLDDLGPLSGAEPRVNALIKARDLIDQMIEEID